MKQGTPTEQRARSERARAEGDAVNHPGASVLSGTQVLARPTEPSLLLQSARQSVSKLEDYQGCNCNSCRMDVVVRTLGGQNIGS